MKINYICINLFIVSQLCATSVPAPTPTQSFRMPLNFSYRRMVEKIRHASIIDDALRNEAYDLIERLRQAGEALQADNIESLLEKRKHAEFEMCGLEEIARADEEEEAIQPAPKHIRLPPPPPPLPLSAPLSPPPPPPSPVLAQPQPEAKTETLKQERRRLESIILSSGTSRSEIARKSSARLRLGMMYLNGLGVKQDYRTAWKNFEWVATQNVNLNNKNQAIIQRAKIVLARGQGGADYNELARLGSKRRNEVIENEKKEVLRELSDARRYLPEAGVLMAEIYLKLENYPPKAKHQEMLKAYKYLDKTLALHPNPRAQALSQLRRAEITLWDKKQDQYQEALKLLQAAANQIDDLNVRAEARVILGQLYLNSNIGPIEKLNVVPLNGHQARLYFEGAESEQENPHDEEMRGVAQLNLGATYLNGIGVPKNHDRAKHYYNQVIAMPHLNKNLRMHAIVCLGLLDLYSANPNYDAAFRYFALAIDKLGHHILENDIYSHVGKKAIQTAEISLAEMYAKGHGVPRDWKQARVYLHKAAEGLNPYIAAQAYFILAFMTYEGKGAPQDIQRVMFLLQQAIKVAPQSDIAAKAQKMISELQQAGKKEEAQAREANERKRPAPEAEESSKRARIEREKEEKAGSD